LAVQRRSVAAAAAVEAAAVEEGCSTRMMAAWACTWTQAYAMLCIDVRE
jgi:hypothetical protein